MKILIRYIDCLFYREDECDLSRCLGLFMNNAVCCSLYEILMSKTPTLEYRDKVEHLDYDRYWRMERCS